MRVWIVVEHYDRGSDEFSIVGVFDSEQKAWTRLQDRYVKNGWRPIIEDDADLQCPERLTYYQDPTDQSGSDIAYIEEREVQ